MNHTLMTRSQLMGGLVACLFGGATLVVRQPAEQTPAPPQARATVTVPPRLNKLIPTLQEGKAIFGNFVLAGAVGPAKQASGSGWDFVIFEMKYSGPELEQSLQFLLDRRQILAQGSLAPPIVPMARIPANGQEMNAWTIKHSLDQGVYGIVFPHISTVEAARHAIVYSRYAQAAGAPDMEPAGHRGVAPTNAQRWWGIPDFTEYHRRADIWPLDPDGELMAWIVIEDEEGIKNLPEILRQVKVSAVIGSEVDLSTNMGLPGGRLSPEVEANLQKILEIGKQFRLPVGALATRDNVERRVREGYQIMITGDPVAIDLGRKAAARAAGAQ